MNRLKPHLAFAFLFLALLSHAQDQQCVQSGFSGEAAQGQEFSQEFGEGLVFRIVPMRDAPWGWFKIRVADESHANFIFNSSDENWFLATADWGSAFIGGFRSDQKAALEYRLRYLIFPMSFDDKETLKKIAAALYTTKDSEEEHSSITELKSMRLGQMKFEITDYRFAEGEPPMSLEWVKFTAIVTVPADFILSEKLVAAKLSIRYVECPAIPDQVIANIRNPKRHQYFLPTDTAIPAKP